MKKPLPVAAIVAAGFVVLIFGWFAFMKMSEDPVVTGTKTSGYGPGNMPPPPSFKIPPPPASAIQPGGPSGPPPAGMRPPAGG